MKKVENRRNEVNRKFKYGVVIGRFQPVHLGHLYMIEQALLHCDKVLILVGSAHRAPTIKNPFSFTVRQQLLCMCLRDIQPDYLDRIEILPSEDLMYNEQKWIGSIKSSVGQYCQQDDQIALVAHDKDASTYYLAHFSQWQFIELEHYHHISATPIREAWFAGALWQDVALSKHLSLPTIKLLKSFEETDEYQRLKREFDCVKQYQREWSGTPYPPIFTTTDSVVICQDHLLLVRRKYPPGQHLLALPGGFLEAGEWIQKGLLREFREETSIDLSDEILLESLVSMQVFDHPDRCQIGRVITHAGYFNLPQQTLPDIKAADDALEAMWYPLSQKNALKDQMHDDHYYILSRILGS